MVVQLDKIIEFLFKTSFDQLVSFSCDKQQKKPYFGFFDAIVEKFPGKKIKIFRKTSIFGQTSKNL